MARISTNKNFDPCTQAFDYESLPPRSKSTRIEDAISGHCFINSLPFELLSEIFFHSPETLSSDPNGFHQHVGRLSLATTPLSLLSVCRRWREVALATLSLWDSIFPSFNTIPCIKAWMKISSLPFHLMLGDYSRSTQLNAHHNSEMFRLFTTISHRWKSLSIRLNPGVAEQFLGFLKEAAATGNRIPVKDVYIWMVLSVPDATLSNILSLLPLSTSVERLYWDAEFNATTVPTLPWQLLRTIKVKLWTGTPQELISILSQCALASTVSIFLESFQYPNPTAFPMIYRDPPISLPLLASLELSRQIDPVVLLQRFEFPSLRCLYIQVAHRDMFALANFLKKTPSLETLIIDELGRDMRTSPAGPSLQDIIDYLVIPELRNLPSFKLAFRNSHTIMPYIIGRNPKAWTFNPALLCWREWCHWRGTPASYIGWGRDWSINYLIWKYQQGRFEYMPVYLSKWHDCVEKEIS